MNRLTTYTVQFYGVKAGAATLACAKQVRRAFRVRARDTYDAVDKLNEKHQLREKYLLPRFVFGASAPTISRDTLRRALRATPEQEERS